METLALFELIMKKFGVGSERVPDVMFYKVALMVCRGSVTIAPKDELSKIWHWDSMKPANC